MAVVGPFLGPCGLRPLVFIGLYLHASSFFSLLCTFARRMPGCKKALVLKHVSVYVGGRRDFLA